MPVDRGEVILGNPLTILWIAIPLTIQTLLIFSLGYVLARVLKLSYENAAPAALIGASNHFEVAIATAVMLFGLSSGAALATVVGVLIEVPVMLMLVRSLVNRVIASLLSRFLGCHHQKRELAR